MGSNNYKPTRAAAYAMKARVLFYLGRYDEAGKEAEKALELNNKIDDMRPSFHQAVSMASLPILLPYKKYGIIV